MIGCMTNNLEAFSFERGRTQGILQSYNEDTLNALLKATAPKANQMTATAGQCLQSAVYYFGQCDTQHGQ